MRWPWSKEKKEDFRIPVIEEEKHAMERDTAQIKSLNSYLLIKAAARGWIDTEDVRTLESIQAEGGE